MNCISIYWGFLLLFKYDSSFVTNQGCCKSTIRTKCSNAMIKMVHCVCEHYTCIKAIIYNLKKADININYWRILHIQIITSTENRKICLKQLSKTVHMVKYPSKKKITWTDCKVHIWCNSSAISLYIQHICQFFSNFLKCGSTNSSY